MRKVVASGQFGQLAAGVGDGHKVLPCALGSQGLSRPVVEVLEEGQGLHRAARLGGDDEQRTGRIEPLGVGQDRPGIGAVQHGQVEGLGDLAAKDLAEDLGRQAGAAHAQQQDVGVSLGPHRLRQGIQAVGLRSHRFGDVQPAQPVGDLGGLWLPHGMVVGPDAGHDPVLDHLFQGGVHQRLVLPQAGRPPLPLIQQTLSLFGDAVHQRLKGLGKGSHALVLQSSG